MEDDCISVHSSDFSEADESSPIPTRSSSTREIRYGYQTIPLHPILARRERVLITQENVDTFKQTAKRCRQSVEAWGPSIAYVRDEFITYELCKAAIANNEHSICSIKPHLLKKEEYYNLCLAAATENGWTMRDIPPNVQTQELCDAGIHSICWAIQFCRDEFKTYQNCLSAVSRNGATLEYVPRNFITKEMCEAAVLSRHPCLEYIPKEFLTKELCEMAVESNGKNVANVPDEFMSSELAFTAITTPEPSNPSATMAGANIQYIAAKYLTREIILESVSRWSSTYSRIPKECLTESIENEVLEIAPSCIQYMTQTPERCMTAVKKSPYVIESIQKEYITRELAEYVLTKGRQYKQLIPTERWDYLESLLHST